MEKKDKNKNIGPFLAFNEAYFVKHQKTLLFFLNAPILKVITRYIFRIHSFDCPINKKITSIAPNRFTIDAGLKPFKYSELVKTFIENTDKEKEKQKAIKLLAQLETGKLEDVDVLLPAQTTDFRTHPKYAKRLYFAFKPIWWAMHYWDELLADRHVPELSFGFSTLTAYPDAGTGGTTVVGGVYRQGVSESWGTIRVGAGTGTYTSQDDGNSFIMYALTDAGYNGKFTGMRRAIMTFDTSGLGSGVTISAAVLSLYGVLNYQDGSWAADVDIYTSTPASNNDLVNADFNQIGTTSQTGSPILVSAFSTSGYNAFNFNATGISNVSKTGISKFGTRNANYDVANSTPPNGDSNQTNCKAYFSDHTGTSFDPKIVVTYSTPSNYTQNLTETITLVESQLRQTAKPIIETISLNEIFSRLATTYRAFTETVTLVDTNTPVKIAVKSFQEVVTLVDSMTEKITAKVLTEVVTLVETMTNVATMFRSLTETITLVDTISAIRQWARAFTETVTLVEANIVRTTSKVFAEIFTMAENFTKAFTHSMTLTDAFTLVDTKTVVHIFNRSFVETVTLVDNVTRATAYVLHFIENLNITARFLGLINGKDIRYIQKYISRAGTYIKKYLNIPDEE